MSDVIYFQRIGKKRIVKKFLLLPFKDNGRNHWMKYVLMVQVLLPMPVLATMDWCDVRIATIDDIINI